MGPIPDSNSNNKYNNSGNNVLGTHDMKELWVEKYRPKTVSEYVFRDDQRKQVESLDKKKNYIPLAIQW